MVPCVPVNPESGECVTTNEIIRAECRSRASDFSGQFLRENLKGISKSTERESIERRSWNFVFVFVFVWKGKRESARHNNNGYQLALKTNPPQSIPNILWFKSRQYTEYSLVQYTTIYQIYYDDYSEGFG